LLVTALGAFASIGAIVFELGASHRSVPELALATVTIALSWSAVHTIFALHYATIITGRQTWRLAISERR